MTTALMATTVVLGIIGSVLYLAGYFWGGLLLVAAVGAWLYRYRTLYGPEEFGALQRRWLRAATVPAMGIVIAIVVGAILMFATGYNAINAYGALFYGGLVRNWHISVLNAAPLIFTALSVSLAFKAGLFNIGAEGQYYLGAMAATWLGIRLGLPGIITIPLVLLFAGLMGALWNIIPAVLKVRTGAHEVITTMMLAHTARYLSPIFIRANGGDPADSTHPYVTFRIAEQAELPRFQEMFGGILGNANYRLHTGILLAVVAALLVHLLLTRTKIGFEIRAVGENLHAARAQGIGVGRTIVVALMMAGFLAGLAGFNQVTGLDHRLFENLQAGFGWNGISVALLAGGNPIGVIFTGLLWGALDAGGQYMSRTTQTPGAVVEIVKGLILFLIVARYIYTMIANARKRRRERTTGVGPGSAAVASGQEA